jgi:hypothetical protein
VRQINTEDAAAAQKQQQQNNFNNNNKVKVFAKPPAITKLTNGGGERPKKYFEPSFDLGGSPSDDSPSHRPGAMEKVTPEYINVDPTTANEVLDMASQQDYYFIVSSVCL